MSSSSPRRAVIVGLFVAVGLVILAAGILTVGNLRDTFSRKIEVSAVFDEVNGLQAGDNVWCSGLKVGAVRDLRFTETAQVEVQLLLDAEVTKFIHRDAHARLGSDGLIGNPIVILDGGSLDAPILQPGDVIEVETTVSTRDVLAMLQKNNENLLAITADIRTVTGRIVDGEGTVGRLLSEDGLYVQVSDAVGELEAASENARRLTASLATFSAKLNTPGNLPHDLVTDQTIYDAIASAAQQLEQATTKVGALVDGIGEGLQDQDAAVGALLHDPELGDDLKATMDRLRVGSGLLTEDLKALQSNFLLRPYFKKQEREARKAAKAEAEGR